MSPARTEGGLKLARAGSVSADNPFDPSTRPGSDSGSSRGAGSLAPADNPGAGDGSGRPDNRLRVVGAEGKNPSRADIPSEDDASSAALADNAPEGRELGLYVHVPFCAKRCGYCSFNTAPLEDGAMARYLIALHREIDLLGELAWSPHVRLATIFLGGGTPSLLAAEELAAV